MIERFLYETLNHAGPLLNSWGNGWLNLGPLGSLVILCILYYGSYLAISTLSLIIPLVLFLTLFNRSLCWRVTRVMEDISLRLNPPSTWSSIRAISLLLLVLHVSSIFPIFSSILILLNVGWLEGIYSLSTKASRILRSLFKKTWFRVIVGLIIVFLILTWTHVITSKMLIHWVQLVMDYIFPDAQGRIEDTLDNLSREAFKHQSEIKPQLG